MVLRQDVFDRLTEAAGATTDIARARLLGVDRVTIFRLRRRMFQPRWDTAARFADVLGCTLDDLFERVA